MKETTLDKAIKEVSAIKLRAVDILMGELVEPLTKLGNPEELIKKPYEWWSPQDLAFLTQIYGTKEPNLLSNLIFRKEYNKVRQLEQTEEVR